MSTETNDAEAKAQETRRKALKLLATNSATRGLRDREAEDAAAKTLLAALVDVVKESATYEWEVSKEGGKYHFFGYESPQARSDRYDDDDRARRPDATLTYAEGKFHVSRLDNPPRQDVGLTFDIYEKAYVGPLEGGVAQPALICLVTAITGGGTFLA
jgi:hypothetical protein